MMRQIIRREVDAAKTAFQALVEWIHPTMVMKRHAFDRPLDDLGQAVDELDRKAAPREPGAAASRGRRPAARPARRRRRAR